MELSRRALLRGGVLAGAGSMLGALPLGEALAHAAQLAGTEAQWPSVTALVDRYVRQRKVAGMVATLGWGTADPAYIMRGQEGFDDRDMASPASLYRAYSMTKPVTGMAAMMLIDEGKLGLDQKLADFAPEFAEMRVAIDPRKSLASRPARVPITIRHLLTHSSGLGYAMVGRNKVADELKRLGVIPGRISHISIPGVSDGPPTPGPDEFLRRAATVPLVFEPGTQWRYSMALDVLGIVIQRASGARSFADFLAERMFAPLGMGSSFFQVPESDVPRLTTNYGLLAGFPLAIDKPGKSIFLDAPAFAFGGSGLVTTASDFDKFLAMIANAGMSGNRRVMSEAAVRMGTSHLLPAGINLKGTWVDGYGFGAGGLIGLGKQAGLYGWSGAAGTIGFVNWRSKLRSSLYVQYMPQDRYPILKEFPRAVLSDAAAKPINI